MTGPSPLTHGGEGATYVFRQGPNETWTEQSKLQPSDVAADDEFGLYGLAIGRRADTLAIASYHKNMKNGAVYLFAKP